MNNKMNPLSQYTKIEKVFTKLCTNDIIKYKSGVLSNSSIECGVCARSARDEMLFNNPEALMNGEAVVQVIENCVPNVTSARDLYLPDVEQLLIAIKLATKEKSYDIETKCPKCEKHGAFERDLQILLDTIELVSEEPVVNMDSGLAVYLKPHTWAEHSHFGNSMFRLQNQMKHSNFSETDMTDADIRAMSALIDSMARIQFDMLLLNISRIELPDENSTVVSEREFILSWLESLTKDDLQLIMDKAQEVNDWGVQHSMDVSCSECGHEWTMDNLMFDPTSFFKPSFSTQAQKK